MTSTIPVRSHTRKKPEKAPDPLAYMFPTVMENIKASRKAITVVPEPVRVLDYAPPVAELETEYRARRSKLIEMFQPWFWRRG
jgi:hypothetical protein